MSLSARVVANLSYFQLKKYMKTLIAKKLLHQVSFDDRKNFTITDKGRHYVKAFRELSSLLNDHKPIYSRY
ncbi:MAG: winged helix-turn-helix domain-containing protein [Candidatus Kariarchaeaceae archaeon]